MTRIVWDKTNERFYQSGVSRGVFYTADSRGVPWNGLTSVEENNTDNIEPLYFDGVKYADVITLGDFQGKIKAFTYPDEMLEYEGIVASRPGFYLTDQPKKRFGLSYRTEISNDQTDTLGYKLHLVYNVLAVPTTLVHETMSLNTEPTDFEWEISAIPEEVDRFRPTAHVIFDSRNIDAFLLADVEDILYGTFDNEPLLPSLSSLVNFIQKWGRLIITDNGDGTWTAESPVEGIIVMLDSTTFQIDSDTAVYLDADSYTIASSALDTEDIWP